MTWGKKTLSKTNYTIPPIILTELCSYSVFVQYTATTIGLTCCNYAKKFEMIFKSLKLPSNSYEYFTLSTRTLFFFQLSNTLNAFICMSLWNKGSQAPLHPIFDVTSDLIFLTSQTLAMVLSVKRNKSSNQFNFPLFLCPNTSQEHRVNFLQLSNNNKSCFNS